MLEVKSLTKAYSRRQAPALDSASFEVRDGEIVGFVGLNGAGKTTTIRVAAGVSLPTSGTVLVDGHDVVNEKAEASKGIGWVPEFPNYEQNARAKSLLLYFAGFREMGKEDASRRSSELLARVGLSGFEQKKIRTFSQGMKKRFSLAAALLPDPQNYLFDEILNGLDPEGIHFMRALMHELKSSGKAVLLSSHILSEIENVADRVVFIHKGKIIKIATRDELSIIATSGGVLKIVIQNLNADALAYLETLGKVKVEEGNAVLLSGYLGDPTQVSTELIKRGFFLREFSFEKSSLEEYFFKLVETNPDQMTHAAGS